MRTHKKSFEFSNEISGNKNNISTFAVKEHKTSKTEILLMESLHY